MSVLLWVLRIFFGRKIDEKAHASAYLKGYKPEDLKPSSEFMNFRGFPASVNVVVTFAFLVIVSIIGWISFETRSDFIERLFGNPLFVLAVVITALWLLDRVLPRILLSVVNLVIRLRAWVVFCEFRG